MGNLIKTDPFQEIMRFDPFRDFEGFTPSWPRLRKMFEGMPVEPTIKLDVTEDDKAFHVKADLPGVKKEDITVEVDGDQVSVTAEVKRETEEKKDEKVVHSERYYGKQFRSFTLGRPIDRDTVEAKFSEGVLELTLPKNGTTPASRIAIK
ncbi:MAG TPA: Hsp20/alpha crystallin family protein [Usitatibacter sp.]|nr:Hsp20/alpha crystallin family protein [Usitatibacter sp.]